MFPTQWKIASASQCKQASAAALDSCFRRSSTSSACRWRSWSDSLMLESVHVWIWSGITREKIKLKKPSIPFVSAHIIPYLYPQKCQFAIRAHDVSHTMKDCKCKPVQASFSSCLGQLFSKIFNFFCVPLTLLVWLLNAWVCACLDMVGNHQGKNKIKKTKHTFRFCTYHPISIPAKMSICNPCTWCFPHNERLQVQASASKLQQLPWTAVFEDLQLLLRASDAPGQTP